MCDYSLMSLPNLLARQGEELVVYRFPCGAMGLASPSDLRLKCDPLPSRLRNFWRALQGNSHDPRPHSVPAVCIPLGSRLLVRDMQEQLRQEIGVQQTEEVTFTQIIASPFVYGDAIRFWNGREVLLQRLREAQRIRVLDLSFTDFANSDTDATLGLAEGAFTFPLPSAAMDTEPVINNDPMFPG